MKDKFDTKFQIYQIKSRIDKLYQASFGKPHEDAIQFVDLARAESSKGGYFVIIKIKTIA